MRSNPVEVADPSAGSPFCLFPELAKLVLASMPAPGWLAHHPVSPLSSLRILCARDMGYLIGQDSFITTPIIGIPRLTVSFACSIRHQSYRLSG